MESCLLMCFQHGRVAHRRHLSAHPGATPGTPAAACLCRRMTKTNTELWIWLLREHIFLASFKEQKYQRAKSLNANMDVQGFLEERMMCNVHAYVRACVCVRALAGACVLTLHLAVLSKESREMMYSPAKRKKNRVALGCKFKELQEEHLNIEYWIPLCRSQQRLMRRKCEGDRIYNLLMFPASPPTSGKRMRHPSCCSSRLCLVRGFSDKPVQGLRLARLN